jgi:hypothetical protein
MGLHGLSQKEVYLYLDNTICRVLGSHSGGCEEVYLLRYNAVYSVESQPKFQRNISSPSSESKNKPRKRPAYSR